MMVLKKYLIHAFHSCNKIESGKNIHLFEFSFLIFIYMPFNC